MSQIFIRELVAGPIEGDVDHESELDEGEEESDNDDDDDEMPSHVGAAQAPTKKVRLNSLQTIWICVFNHPDYWVTLLTMDHGFLHAGSGSHVCGSWQLLRPTRCTGLGPLSWSVVPLIFFATLGLLVLPWQPSCSDFEQIPDLSQMLVPVQLFWVLLCTLIAMSSCLRVCSLAPKKIASCHCLFHFLCCLQSHCVNVFG